MKIISALALAALLAGCASMHPPQITDPQTIVLGLDEKVTIPVRRISDLYCSVGRLECSTAEGGRLADSVCTCRLGL